MWSTPSGKSKITSAVWGPLDEVIITGHENGDLCQWDISVCCRVHCFHFNHFGDPGRVIGSMSVCPDNSFSSK